MAEREPNQQEPPPPPPPPEAATRADARAAARAPLASLKPLKPLGEGSFSAVELVALPSPRSGGCEVSGGRAAALKRIKVRRRAGKQPAPTTTAAAAARATATMTGTAGAAAPTPRTADAMLRSEREAHARAGGCGFVAHAFGLKQGRAAGAAAAPAAARAPQQEQQHQHHHQDLALLLEYHPGGDLAALLDRRRAEHAASTAPSPHLSEGEARFVAACALLALETLHRARVIHRDLKPANLFVSASGYAVLGDLGCAAVLPQAPLPSSFPGAASASSASSAANPQPSTSPSRCVYRGKHCSAVSGTRAYMAPEVAALKKKDEAEEGGGGGGPPPKKSYGAATDLFSLGASLFELASGELPPPQFSADLALPPHFSPELSALVRALMAPDPLSRPTAVEAQSASFFEGFDWRALRARTMPAPEALARAGAAVAVEEEGHRA
jgi:serine/threonine protein kinase